MGLFRKKEKRQKKCLELDPKYPIAWNNKGIALSKLERYEAIRCYDKAIEIDRECGCMVIHC